MSDLTDEAPVAELPRCSRHNARTRLSCVDCGDPICPKCMVRTDVGQKCERDAAPARSARPPADDEAGPPATSGAHPRARWGLVALVVGTVAIVAATALFVGRGPVEDNPAATSPIGSWQQAPALASVRGSTVAVSLSDGRVAAIGGGVGSVPIAETEVLGPDDTAWVSTSPMAAARRGHTGTRLADDRLLVVGGIADFEVLADAEMSQDDLAAWDSAASSVVPRLGHSATLLRDGRVLVLGGTDPEAEEVLQGRQAVAPTGAADVFDPASGEWTTLSGMAGARFEHTATRLADGRVLIVGGLGVVAGEVAPLDTVELYDPTSDTFSRTGDLATARANHSAVLLDDGRVLVAGGSGETSAHASAEVYEPDRGSWTTAADLAQAREGHTATLLGDGSVLVAGGEFFVGGSRRSLFSAERYLPAEERWASAGDMSCPRSEHGAALLGDGSVLIVAGDSAFPGEPPMAQSCVDRYTP